MRKTLIAVLFALLLAVIAVGQASSTRKWQDSNGTFTINLSTGAWTVTSSPHGSFSGSAVIENQGSYFTFNGSGTAGVDGILFLGSSPTSGSGSADIQSNTGSPFTIAGNFF